MRCNETKINQLSNKVFVATSYHG